MSSVGEELPKLMAKVRDEIMPAYQEIAVAGQPALILMRASLDRATVALAEGDVLQILRAYEDLKGYKL